MSTATHSFIPAMGRHSALRLYDPFVRLIGADRVRSALLQDVELRAGQRVLDVGCGTGTLVVQLKRAQPALDVEGLDPDEQALAISAAKARRAGTLVGLTRGFSDQLPYEGGSFDHVSSCFMFHHLGAAQQERTAGEVQRVLKQDGTFHLLDFEAKHVFAHGPLGLFHRATRGEGTATQELVPVLQKAGFRSVTLLRRARVLVQPVVMYRCVK